MGVGVAWHGVAWVKVLPHFFWDAIAQTGLERPEASPNPMTA